MKGEHITKGILNLMGLTETERLVYRALSDLPESPTLLQKRARVPRVTLDRTLVRLYKRGLAGRKRISRRRNGWFVNHLSAVEGKFGVSIRELGSEDEVIVHHGRNAMFEQTRLFISCHARSRIYVMQTAKTWQAWKALDTSIFKEINELLRINEVIVESVLPDSVLQNIGQTILAGYRDRLAVAHALPGEYFNFTSDISIGNDAVYLMNWRDEIGVKVRNYDMRALFRSLFAFLSESGERLRLTGS